MVTFVLRRPIRLLVSLSGALGLILAISGAEALPESRAAIISYPGRLSGVSALSPSNAWAVGGVVQSGAEKTLIMHWNGRGWSRVASPNPDGARSASLDGVSADSSRDAWAVGSYVTRSGKGRTLVLHWNGRTWRRVPSPDPGGASGSDLAAVSVLSRSRAWAVGGYFTRSGAQKTLVLRWNGDSWAKVASPSRGVPPFSALLSVSALSPSRAWAVGWSYFSTADEQKTLVLRWNGTAWAQEASPDPGPAGDIFAPLSGISAVSPSNAWAVGNYLIRSSIATLVLHWNGIRWAKVASPAPGRPNGTTSPTSELDAVTARSRSNAWAVGDYSTSSGTLKTLILHWNGSRWAKATSPSPGRSLNFLYGVSAASRSSVWAVGTTSSTSSGGNARTLILHWNGPRWSRS